MTDVENDSGNSTARSSSSQSREEDEPGRIWRSLKALLFGNTDDNSLRAQIEEVIDDHESDTEGYPNGNPDVSSLELEMLRNMLHFSEHRVDDIAVPRADIIAIEESSAFEDFVDIFSEHGHSRIPVYRENLDNIIGMIHIKDIFAIVAKGGPFPDDIAPFLRQPRFVPESMGVLDLLAEMRATRTHLAIIFDEYNGTEGLVTIEDIVEEITGEIEDEHDDEPVPLLVQLDDGIWEADARAELDDVGDTIDPALEEIDEDVDTIGGLSFVLAGHIPTVGERLEHPSGWILEITEADDRRVTRLRLHPPVGDESK
ncbi:MAG: HlyC/CorC family transporter [Sphingomonadales bacterium]|nr:HlyC/CorC family transporter [Sphingomonadales bacterium]PIX65239.1 MAG: magnesium/cobalt efflux protein [Sphingomonadales bacterium CG_4_10_14_3_um_filter_58_15]NCO49170.1 HlyC/CorC family transporter [Sphingomonadales bacterium]NCP01443.1 HlyC/CorC family transporter [Sphingomonadales bacterium]NCP27976.1 HlyC/CorC family transporter [Sphingomonadales bacterium]